VWHADGKGFTFTSLAGLQISGVWQVEITESPEVAVSEPKLLFKPSGLASPAQLSSIATSRFRQCASDLPFDAIHLATALELGRDLTVLVTYDERMTAGAKQLGIRTTHPF
jgi:hypothetical protein